MTAKLRRTRLAAASRTLVEQASDPREFQSALADAISLARNLWITFLSVGAFLVVTIGSVSHFDLLLDTPITLPLLNVDLPLFDFFWVAPILYFILHLYLLLQFKLLADNVRLYNSLLSGISLIGKLGPSDEQTIRFFLPNFVLVQVLAGPNENRGGLIGWTVNLILAITTIAFPVILFLSFQLTFLPYHNHGVTWLHRTVIGTDIAMLWAYWPRIISSQSNLWRTSTNFSVSTLVLVFSICIATFPGEFHDRLILSNVPVWIDVKFGRNGIHFGKQVSLYNALFLGEINEVTGSRRSVFANTLVLPDRQLSDLKGFPISLRGRDLREADLARSNLRDADFTGAWLEGANLSGAHLQGARFHCAKSGSRTGLAEGCTHLQGASLAGAELGGANLRGADLRGAWLDKANMYGASLNYAELQGSSLIDAQLQASSLVGANFEGARLDGANLQGSLLENATFQAATLGGIKTWRSHGRWIDQGLRDALVTGIRIQPYWRRLRTDAINADEYNNLLDIALRGNTEDTKFELKRRLSILNPNIVDMSIDNYDSIDWNSVLDLTIDQKKYQRILRSKLRILACDPASGRYISRNLIKKSVYAARTRLEDTGGNMLGLVSEILRCAPAVGLDADTISTLRQQLIALHDSQRAAEHKDAITWCDGHRYCYGSDWIKHLPN